MRSGYIKAQRRRNANGFWRKTFGPHARERGEKTHKGVFVDGDAKRDLLAIGHTRGRDALRRRGEAVTIDYEAMPAGKRESGRKRALQGRGADRKTSATSES